MVSAGKVNARSKLLGLFILHEHILIEATQNLP